MADTGITFSDVLARHARVRPDNLALVDSRRRCTFAQLDDRVTRLANVLSANGVRPGDRVAVAGLNCLELIEVWLATLRLGAVAVPVNFRLVSDEIAHVLADSGAVVVVVDPACATAVAQARAKAPTVAAVLTIGDGWTNSSPRQTVSRPTSRSRTRRPRSSCTPRAPRAFRRAR